MRVQKDFPNPSLTKQSFTKECDINIIVKRFAKSGNIAHVNRRQPVYEDFSNAGSYMDALNAVNQAEERFMGLPAKLRARVNNDPTQLIDFVENEENWPELEEEGWFGPEPLDRVEKPDLVEPEPEPKKEEKTDEGQSD